MKKSWHSPLQPYFNKLAPIADTSAPRFTREWTGSWLPGNTAGTNASISHDYYTQHIGFFCRQELRLEKMSRLPLRFRLGSLKDCNYLEGK